MSKPSIIALIPARAGSKRIPNKNIRSLQGHPLLAYTMTAAISSKIFSDIIVSTDSEEIATIARKYGAKVPFLRSSAYAGDNSPDIEWIHELLTKLEPNFDCFSILRPTSPFRQSTTIQRAWGEFLAHQQDIDSLRAVEKCKQHPAKMWTIDNQLMTPVLKGNTNQAPWHSSPYQALPPIYVQNASLEIAWCRVVLDNYSITGDKVMPFLTQGYEGVDINDEKDWWYVEYLIQQQKAQLPR